LALAQTELVKAELKKIYPRVETETVVIRTSGDKITDTALWAVGDKGLFTRELDQALTKGGIDAAVHSLKDIPAQVEDGLIIAAVLKREDPRDVIISHKGFTWNTLPPEAKIGTSSLRRRAQLKYKRPDLRVEDLRGNVETRIKKMRDGDLDAIVLAYAGVRRLGMDSLITDYLPVDIMMPAAGQGAIALQTRAGEKETRQLLAGLNDAPTYWAVTAERSFLRELQGGCRAPVGAFARAEKDGLNITGLIFGLEGERGCRAALSGELAAAESLGKNLARRLLSAGGNEILKNIKQR
jgi:hydroxymethylbilane synthase